MLSKCANPKCSAAFRYLHDGKLFRMEVPAALASANQSRARKKTTSAHGILLVM
jgi:hypothetical protein